MTEPTTRDPNPPTGTLVAPPGSGVAVQPALPADPTELTYQYGLDVAARSQ